MFILIACAPAPPTHFHHRRRRCLHRRRRHPLHEAGQVALAATARHRCCHCARFCGRSTPWHVATRITRRPVRITWVAAAQAVAMCVPGVMPVTVRHCGGGGGLESTLDCMGALCPWAWGERHSCRGPNRAMCSSCVGEKYHLARGSLVVCVSVSTPQSSFTVVTPNIGLPPFLAV